MARLATRGALWAGFSQYFLFGLGIFKTVIMFRLVSPQYYGLVAVAGAWASYFSFGRLDLRVAVLRSPEGPRVLNTQYWLENLSVLVGLAVAAALAALWPGLVPAGAWPIIFILLGAGLFETLTSTPLYLTEKRVRQDVLGRLTVLISLVGFIVPVGLALGGAPLAALSMDALLPSLITGAGVALFIRWRPGWTWDGAQARAQLRLGLTLLSTGVLGKIVFQFDDWLVGNWQRPNPVAWLASGVTPEGFYSRAYNAGKMPMDVAAGMIGRVALSLYAEGAARGREVLVAAYRQLTWVLAWIIFASSALAFVVADEVVLLLIGREWQPMVPLFRLMFLFIVGRPLFQNNAQLLLAVHAEDDMRRSLGVQAVFMLIACPPAVYWWGAAGASVVVSAMSVMSLLITERYVMQRLGDAAWRVYLVPAAATALVVAAFALLPPGLLGGPLASLILKSLFTAGVFGAALLLFDRRGAWSAWRTLRQGFK